MNALIRMGKQANNLLTQYSGFLIIGTILAMIWANVNFKSYEHVAHSLHFVVVEIVLAFFFFLASKEGREAMLKGEPKKGIPDGPLASVKQAALPLVQTVGGVVGPAGLYLVFAHFGGIEGLTGWQVPMATDIAFSYAVAKMVFGPKHPIISLLLVIAIGDDFLVMGIMAATLPQKPIMPAYLLGLTGLAVALSLFMWKKLKVHHFAWYLLIPGSISWFGFYLGGLHPALALVPLAFTMPHARSDLGIFASEELRRHDTLSEAEHFLKYPVEIGLGFFGFVSAGVPLGEMGDVTWYVFASLIIGKIVGISIATVIGVKIFRLALPTGTDMRDVIVMAATAAIGFTVAIFAAGLAFVKVAALMGAAKMGAMLSFLAAPLSFVLNFLLRRGREKIG